MRRAGPLKDRRARRRQPKLPGVHVSVNTDIITVRGNETRDKSEMPTTNRPWLNWIAVVALMTLIGFHNDGLRAQHAKPAFKVVPAVDAIKLYWSDALNQFKAVRAPTPHDSEPMGMYSTVRYDVLVAPQGAQVWDEFGEHPLLTEKRGRNDLRNGLPQLALDMPIAAVRNRAAAEKLFNELKAVVLVLPGAQRRGDQYPFQVSVGVKARPDRRSITLWLSDEAEENGFVIDVRVAFNEDDPVWDGGGGA